MPRPKKKEGLAYFPLDVNFFEKEEIKDLKWTHGPVGILAYLNLLSRMYAKGYYIEFKDINVLARSIAADITSDQQRKTAIRVTETINHLVGNGVLDEGLFEQGVISGVAIQEQYILSAHKMRRREIRFDVYTLVDVLEVLRKNEVIVADNTVIVTKTGVYVAKSTQSKSNSNSIYNNNNIHTTTNNNIFYFFKSENEYLEALRSEKEMKAPSRAEVMGFFYIENLLEAHEGYEEAQKFIDYNTLRGWTCLPNWQAAARRWIIQRGGEHGKNE